MHPVLFLTLLITIPKVYPMENKALNGFLKEILQVRLVRNWLLDSTDFVQEFHKSGIPTIILNDLEIIDHPELSNDLNVCFMFVQNSFPDISKLWKKRLIHIIVGDFKTEDVKQFSEYVFQKYWMTHLSFTNLSFTQVWRFAVSELLLKCL